MSPKALLSPQLWFTGFGLLLLRLLTLLPFPLLIHLGRLTGDLLYRLLPSRRIVAEINIAHAFPDYTPEQQNRLVREHFKNAGCALFEGALSWWGSERQIEKLTHIHGIEHLQQAKKEGRGVILLSAHFTSFELCGRMLGRHYPFFFVYKKQRKNPLFESFTMRKRLHHFQGAIPHRDSRQLIRKLKQGHACWYLPDQDFGEQQSQFVPFMGVQTATTMATSRLAKIGNALVIPYYPLRRKDGSGYDLHILPPLENFPSEDIRSDCLKVNQSLEAFIQRDPAQYLWIHRRFRSRPPGEPPFYPPKKRE